MPKYTGYDFCGWATRNDIRCSDGRTIKRDAFAHQDGQKVPLVWGHNHDSPEAVLGHGFLENRPEGVFFYGYFNDSDLAQAAKRDVAHGDVTSLSIWANQLKQKAGDVLHGSIKEVSLVLAGANMGAQITNPVVVHGEDCETIADEAYIYVGEEYGLELSHADVDEDEEKEKETEPEEQEEEPEMDEEKKEKTVQDVLDSMDEDQLKVVSYLVAKAAEEGLDDDEDDEDDEEDEEEIEHSDYDYDDDEGDYEMNFNAFEGVAPATNFVSHSDQEEILSVAKKYGSLKQALEAYAEENELQHDSLASVSGFTSYPSGSTPAGVDALFPDYHDVRPGAPELVTNDQTWVKAVLSKVHKSPFSRIRTSSVDIREIEEIRARGYAKGKEKVLAGNYAVAKRATDPQTVYVKSALNRDDIVDITDFDYVNYQYKIDRMQLELELARAILIGDGRDAASPDKISTDHIRAIWTDPDLYTIHKTLTLATGTDFGTNYLYASAMEEALLDAKIDYRGTGAADMFCSQEFFNKILLAKDLNGRRIYKDKNEVAAALDVANVYNVPEFANKTRTVTVGSSQKTMKLLAIIGNLADYSLGATKGGEITHFTDFDIDFNQEKSLIETRCSGATTRIYSFIVIEEEVV